VRRAARISEEQGETDQLSFVAVCLSWIDELALGLRLASRAVAIRRAESALWNLPYDLAALADLQLRSGRVTESYASAYEAVRLADETGQTTALAYNLTDLARVEACRGLEDDCRAHAARAEALAASSEVDAVAAYAGGAVGLLALGTGQVEEAVALLAQVTAFLDAGGVVEPAVLPVRADLVEALVRAGRPGEARVALRALQGAAVSTGRASALAAAARAEGLLAEHDAFTACFEAALVHHQRVPGAFERARTELCFGERLRRAGQRTDARARLRAALAVFDELGAAPWAERARVELRASGESLRQRDPGAAEQLTPQELQVALLVADGATNAEAAARLFLTRKTVEFHLTRIYRKLRVRSRAELARSLGG
jgi:DNA-binding CsgD family transcriptional regulator